MSIPVSVPSGAGDVQAVTGSCTLVGYSVRESAGSPAVATLVLRDGTSAAGAFRAGISLAASGVDAQLLPAVEFASGIFVDRVSGTTELVLYLD
jgi:hypothetical protein